MERVNKFLRDFADKWYLFIVFCIVFVAWLAFKHDFLAQLSRDLVMAMLAIAGFKRTAGETTITTDTVKTPAINNETMPGATINVSQNDSADLPPPPKPPESDDTSGKREN